MNETDHQPTMTSTEEEESMVIETRSYHQINFARPKLYFYRKIQLSEC